MQSRRSGVVRYAIVGLGHIAQVAVLPAFAHARRNSRLAALVSDDPTKLKAVSRKYGVKATCSYDEYDACLEQVDASTSPCRTRFMRSQRRPARPSRFRHSGPPDDRPASSRSAGQASGSRIS